MEGSPLHLGVLAIIILIFMALLSYLALQGYKTTQTAEDYLVAGRKIQPGIMALSYGATFISTSAIIGFGGAAGFWGFGLLWLTFLNIFLGIIIAFVLFGVPVRRLAVNLGCTTFPELLGERYLSPFLTFLAGIMIFIFLPAYTSIILIGGGRFLEATLKIDFHVALFILALIIGAYVITGGLKAVMYTDTLCAIIILTAMVVLLFYTYQALGGILPAHEGLTALKNKVPEELTVLGHQGWTAMPRFGSPIWWTLISTMITGVGIGVLAQPQLIMRFMTVKKTSSLYRAVSTGSIFIFFTTGAVFLAGALSNLYFIKTRGDTALTVAENNIDLIIPLFINSLMPPWYIYLFIIALFSAAISTLSSLIHVQGASWGRDLVPTVRLWRGKSKPSPVNFIVRIGVFLGVVLAIILAYALPPGIIAHATAFWFSICASGFLPSLIGALYWKRSTRLGAIASIISGFTVSVAGYIILNINGIEAAGIPQVIAEERAFWDYPWMHVNPLFYALPVSTIVFIAVSLLTPPPPEIHLKKCFKKQ